MKKLIALLLALTVVAATAAGCTNTKNDETTESTTEATTEATTGETTAENDTASNSAAAVLQKVWDLYGEDEKFFAYGGDGTNMVEGQPAGYTDMEALENQLLLPPDWQSSVTQIGSLFHGMNLNNFTAGCFKLADGVEAAAFADTLHDAALDNQWMCGFPEKLLIADVDGAYTVLVFGLTDFVDAFQGHLTEAYDQVTVRYAEALSE